MNALDKLISWVSPASGLKRARARMALDFVRGYEGAKVGRRTAGWQTGGTSADAEISPARTKLRERSRDLIRNSPYAARACGSWVENVIGTGIVASLSEGQDAWESLPSEANGYARGGWVTYCDADGLLDFYGIEALVARTMFESGECLVRLRWRRPEDGFEIPLQLQVLEPDYIDSLKNEALDGGGIIDQGIEYDAIGRRVAFWLYPQHPGAIFPHGVAMRSRRVSAEDVIHVFEVHRPGQSRGVPRLASAMLKARDLDEYEEAELLRKGIESCFAAFVETDDESLLAGQEKTKVEDRTEESIAAGMIKYLRPGERITFGAPAASSGYTGYVKTQYHAIASGAGVTYEMMTGDLSQTNYSSMRGGKLEFRRGAEQWQHHTFIPQFCRRVEDAFRRAAALAGNRKAARAAFDWTTPKWEWVDPLKDASGVILELAAGLTSWEEEARRRGWTPQQLLDQIAANQAAFKQAGVSIQWDQLVLGALAVAAQPDQQPGAPSNG